MSRPLFRCCALIVLVVSVATVTACNDDPAPMAPEQVTQQDIHRVIDRGVAYIADHIDEIDWGNLALVDYLYRNWRLNPLGGAREHAADLAEAGTAGIEQTALGRMLDPAFRPTEEAVEAFGGEPNYPLVAALYCDVDPMGPDDLDALRALNDQGGYGSTHAAIAIGWMEEFDCSVPGLQELRNTIVDRIATEFHEYRDLLRQVADEADVDLEAVADRAWVTDLALEQSAVLLYLGEGAQIDEAWTREVAANQRPDGGWDELAIGTDESHWHPTLLAVWTLLESTVPGEGEPMIVRD